MNTRRGSKHWHRMRHVRKTPTGRGLEGKRATKSHNKRFEYWQANHTPKEFKDKLWNRLRRKMFGKDGGSE